MWSGQFSRIFRVGQRGSDHAEKNGKDDGTTEVSEAESGISEILRPAPDQGEPGTAPGGARRFVQRRQLERHPGEHRLEIRIVFSDRRHPLSEAKGEEIESGCTAQR